MSDAQATVIAAVISLCGAAASVAVAAFNPFAARNLERLKTELAKQFARSSARIEYEFEARKRLYAEFEPLLFQLGEATEGAYYRVVSLVRTQKAGKLGAAPQSWLSEGRGGSVGPRYYATSTIYLLFLPLVIYRLIQRSATFFDLSLDADIRTKYYLLKAAAVLLTDDYEIAKVAPALEYEPSRTDWATARLTASATIWRQGLVIGHLEQFLDAMIIVEGAQRRPMTFGEFQAAVTGGKAEFLDAYEPAADILRDFSFDTRPVLGRILLAYAVLMDLLSRTYASLPPRSEMEAAVDIFANSDKAKDILEWCPDPVKNGWGATIPYLKQHLGWVYKR
ncbi:MAG: hypothetical protein WDM86_00545 [Rhizomicrobium sp.]